MTTRSETKTRHGHCLTSRRRFLTAAASGTTTVLLAGCGDGGAASKGSVQPAPTAPDGLADGVATIPAAFDEFSVVALGEYHGLQEGSDCVVALVHHPDFPDKANDIVVESCNAKYQNLCDRFVNGEPVDNADLRRIWRDTTQSPNQAWDASIYEQFFRVVRGVNQGLPEEKRLRVLLGDLLMIEMAYTAHKRFGSTCSSATPTLPRS